MSNPIREVKGVFRCRKSEETRQLGRKLGERAERGWVLALDGPLGAGKTEFVKGLAAGLGCKDEVASPTFAIAHEYEGGRWLLHHLDFYRLESEDEILTCGLDERVGVLAIEWASKFRDWLPKETLWVRLEILESGERLVSIE